MISQITETPLLQQAMVTSFILAFSGLSIQAQVASILAETDIRFKPYFSHELSKVFLPLFLLLYFGNHFMKSKLFFTYAKDIPVFYRIILLFCMNFGHLLYTTDRYLHYFAYMYMSSYYFSSNKEKPRSL